MHTNQETSQDWGSAEIFAPSGFSVSWDQNIEEGRAVKVLVKNLTFFFYFPAKKCDIVQMQLWETSP
jgi:hypothetical protein